jgi:hypothetical protein
MISGRRTQRNEWPRRIAVERVTGIEPAWPAWKGGECRIQSILKVLMLVYGDGDSNLDGNSQFEIPMRRRCSGRIGSFIQHGMVL